MKPIILMDLDGTVVDFNGAFGEHLRKLGIDVPKGFIPITSHWEEDPIFKGREQEVLDGYESFKESGFHTEPLPGACKFLKELDKDYEIVYCTSRRDPQAIKATYELVQEKFPLGSIIFTGDKTSVAKAMKPLAIMEDSPHHIEPLKAYCKHILVPRARYNSKPVIKGVHYVWGFKGPLALLQSILEQLRSRSSE